MYVNKVIAIVTDVMPNNCNECVCTEQQCRLPLNKDNSKLSKRYKDKRHKDCLLVLENQED